MKKAIFLAAVGGLTLVSAHPPQHEAPGPIEARSGYPACSRTVTDRCIQLYERGVRTPTNLARNAAPTAEPQRVMVARAPTADDDDIDVAYAGEVLQAPRAGHHPAGHAAPHHAMPHHPGPDRVVIREHRQAHATAPAAVAHHAHRPVVLAAASPRAYPACGAGTSDRCRQVRHHAPRRPVPMRVRRAGERG